MSSKVSLFHMDVFPQFELGQLKNKYENFTFYLVRRTEEENLACVHPLLCPLS